MMISKHDEFRKHVFETSLIPIVIIEAESNLIIDCNLAAIKIYGLHSIDDVIGKTPLDFSAPVQYDGTPSSQAAVFYIEKALREGSVVFDWKQQGADGVIRDTEVHLLFFKIDGKQLLQYSLFDNTERKTAEKTQKLLHDLILDLDSCDDLYDGFYKVLMSVLQLECLDCGGIYIADPVDKSLSLAAYSGLSKEFISHVSYYEPDSQSALMAHSGEARYGVYSELRKENDAIRENEGLRALAFIPIMVQGNLIALLNCASHKYDSVPLSTRGILETIALQVGGSLLRLRTANALRENQDLFELFMFHSPIYSYIKEVTATESRVLQASDSFKTLVGLSGRDIRGKTMQELFPAAFAERITADDLNVVSNKKVIKLDEEFNGRCFTTFKFPIVQGKRTLLAGYTIDITDRKRTEETLINAQKLESLGVLAGGIAHDFNNLMGGIYGFIEIASDVSTEESVRRYLAKTMQTIDNARSLTQQLLTFAKGGSPTMEVSPLFPFVQQTAQFALSGSTISCHVDVAQDLWTACFDKNQIGQVINNLIINAQQAMPFGGTIHLSACNIHIAHGDHPVLKQGDYVRISVTDPGIGIPKEIQKRIFDPFFTTKAKGHGLGLATCYSIINRHGGCIDVYSESGKGSTFKVYLPATIESASHLGIEKKQGHKGCGTFLVMDDEEVMRETICAMLQSFGYNVVCTQNGQEAVDYVTTVLRENKTFKGMLFDLTVPGGMGGKDAIEQIRKMQVNVPAFVASGYADDPIIMNPVEYGFTDSISKPFMRVELIEMLEKHMKRQK